MYSSTRHPGRPCPPRPFRGSRTGFQGSKGFQDKGSRGFQDRRNYPGSISRILTRVSWTVWNWLLYGSLTPDTSSFSGRSASAPSATKSGLIFAITRSESGKRQYHRKMNSKMLVARRPSAGLATGDSEFFPQKMSEFRSPRRLFSQNIISTWQV